MSKILSEKRFPVYNAAGKLIGHNVETLRTVDPPASARPPVTQAAPAPTKLVTFTTHTSHQPTTQTVRVCKGCWNVECTCPPDVFALAVQRQREQGLRPALPAALKTGEAQPAAVCAQCGKAVTTCPHIPDLDTFALVVAEQRQRGLR